MSAISNTSWTKWLNDHATSQVYVGNPTKVIKLLTRSSDSAGFNHLAMNKNLVLMTRASLGKKTQATFHHSVVGIPSMSDDVSYVARSGMKFGIGIEFHLDTMFKKTPSKAVPAILDMMKVTTDNDFTALRDVASAKKKKIDFVAVLTPSLVEAIQSSNMTHSSIFVKRTEQIKVSIPVPAATTTSAGETSTTAPATAAVTTIETPAPETVDQILIRLGTIYAPIIRFLWASEKIPNDITPTHLLCF